MRLRPRGCVPGRCVSANSPGSAQEAEGEWEGRRGGRVLSGSSGSKSEPIRGLRTTLQQRFSTVGSRTCLDLIAAKWTDRQTDRFPERVPQNSDLWSLSTNFACHCAQTRRRTSTFPSCHPLFRFNSQLKWTEKSGRWRIKKSHF